MRLITTIVVVGLFVLAVASATAMGEPSGHAYHHVKAAVGKKGSWVSLTYDTLGWNARVRVRGNITLSRSVPTRTYKLEFDAATTLGWQLKCRRELLPSGQWTAKCPESLHGEPQPIYAIFQTANTLRVKYVRLHAGFNRFDFRVQVWTPNRENKVGAVFVTSPALLHLHGADVDQEKPLLHVPDVGILFNNSI